MNWYVRELEGFCFFFNGGIEDSRNLPHPSAAFFPGFIQDHEYLRTRGKKTHTFHILYTTDLPEWAGSSACVFSASSGSSPVSHCPFAIHYICVWLGLAAP